MSDKLVSKAEVRPWLYEVVPVGLIGLGPIISQKPWTFAPSPPALELDVSLATSVMNLLRGCPYCQPVYPHETNNLDPGRRPGTPDRRSHDSSGTRKTGVLRLYPVAIGDRNAARYRRRERGPIRDHEGQGLGVVRE